MNLFNLFIISICHNQMCNKSVEAGARQYHLLDKTQKLESYVNDETPYSLKVLGGITYGTFRYETNKTVGYGFKDPTGISNKIRMSGAKESGAINFIWNF